MGLEYCRSYHDDVGAVGILVRPKIAWDIDGTLYHNFLELDFFGCVDRWSGRDKILPFNQRNPLVRTEDVKYVLTFRPTWWREQTERELVRHGFSAILLMNPSTTDVHAHESVDFKAKILDMYQFDIYIDDDDCLRRRLQPLTKARCMSTQEFYLGRCHFRLW